MSAAIREEFTLLATALTVGTLVFSGVVLGDIPEIGSLLEGGRPILVYVYRDRCPYCVDQGAVIDRVEADYGPLVAFLRVDAGEDPEFADELGVSSYPTIFIFNAGSDTGYTGVSHSGFTDELTIRDCLNRAVNGTLHTDNPIVCCGCLASGEEDCQALQQPCEDRCEEIRKMAANISYHCELAMSCFPDPCAVYTPFGNFRGHPRNLEFCEVPGYIECVVPLVESYHGCLEQCIDLYEELDASGREELRQHCRTDCNEEFLSRLYGECYSDACPEACLMEGYHAGNFTYRQDGYGSYHGGCDCESYAIYAGVAGPRTVIIAEDGMLLSQAEPFNASGTDQHGDEDNSKRVDMVKWTFGYLESEDNWEQLQTITTEANPRDRGDDWLLSQLYPDEDLLMAFAALIEQYGEGPDGGKSLYMNVSVEAYMGDVYLSRSPYGKFPHRFKAQMQPIRLKLDLNETMDVYPTEPNGTAINLSYIGMTPNQPILLEVIGPTPAYLNLSLHPRSINPASCRDGSNLSQLSVEFDYSRAGGLALPSEHKLTIRATNGTVQTSSEIVLHLLKPDWLVMLYMCADTNPDVERSLMYNIHEICRVSESTGSPKVGMMVLMDLRRTWIAHPVDVKVLGVRTFPANNAQLYQVVNGNLSQIGADWGPSNLSSEAVLERFVRESVSRIPSEHTHLIISDHGGGIRGIGWDFHQGDRPMKYSPMKAALKDYKPDIISFNACLMAQTEVLYHLRDVAKYFTCSECTVPGHGHAFEKFLTNVTQTPEISVLEYVKAIVKPFEARYDGSPGSYYTSNVTLSGIDSSKLVDVASTMDGLAKAIHSKYESHDASFNRTMSQVVYRSWEADGEPYTDVMDFAQNILDEPGIADKEIRQAAMETIAALQSALVANVEVWFNGTGHRKPSGYNGLTALIWRKGYDYSNGPGVMPSTIYRSYLKHYDETAFANDTAWRAFLDDFAKSLPANVHALTLLHPGHELYLHVYSRGRHVGYNPSIIDHNMNQIELGIPDSFYIDYRNGTKTILLPSDLKDFEVVVDGSYMEELLEPYRMECALILHGQVVDAKTLENSISLDTEHTTSVTVQEGELIMGETTIQTVGENPSLSGAALALAAIVASLQVLPATSTTTRTGRGCRNRFL